MTSERRTHEPRRKEDVAIEIARWIAPLVRHWGIVLGIGAVIGSVLTIVGTAYALRYTDPAKEARAVRSSLDTLRTKVDSSVIPRLGRVEDALTTATTERDSLKDAVRWMIYLQCRAELAREPKAYVPDICSKGRPK